MITEKVHKMGGSDFHVPLKNVYTSAYVTGQYLRTHVIRDDEIETQKVFVVGEQGLKDELKKAGLQVINDVSAGWVHNPDPQMSIDEFSTIEVDSSVKVVVAGIHYDFNYRTLCLASLFI